MLIEKQGGGAFIGGPLDFICILHGNQQGRYHPCFVEEKPLPGPVPSVEETDRVQVKSKMHHTQGFATFEEAVKDAQTGLVDKIELPEGNIALDRAIPCNEQEMAFTMLLPNWVVEIVGRGRWRRFGYFARVLAGMLSLGLIFLLTFPADMIYSL